MTGFVPESPIVSSLPFNRLPEDHNSGDHINRSATRETWVGDWLRAWVPFVGNSRLEDAVLPLFEGTRQRTQRRPPCFSVCGELPSARRCPPVVQGEGNVLGLGNFHPVCSVKKKISSSYNFFFSILNSICRTALVWNFHPVRAVKKLLCHPVRAVKKNYFSV